MPVATLTYSRWSTSDHDVTCSPRAITLTSLSTRTGTGNWRARCAGMSNSCHPGMIGGFAGRPVECSTGPGTPIPMPTTWSSAMPIRFNRSCARSVTRSRTTVGPSAMSDSTEVSSSTLPARSTAATAACEAPRSIARTTWPAPLRANRVGGRPPVEAASPTGASRPEASRASTRRLMVERASELSSESSALVRGLPSRRCWNRSPAPGAVGEGEGTPAGGPGRGRTAMAKVNHVHFWSQVLHKIVACRQTFA